MLEAVIFDMDGLLADTEKLHMAAYRKALGAYGRDLDDRKFSEHWIRDGKGIAEYLQETKIPLLANDIRRIKAEVFLELVSSSAEPMPGAIELLRMLESRKRLALASSSYRADVDGILNKLGIVHYFETIVSRSDVLRVKPFPDIFLCAAERMRLEPAQCVVIEDAEKGIVAAHRAGMKSIAVPNIYTINNDFSKASIALKSLDEITPVLLDSL